MQLKHRGPNANEPKIPSSWGSGGGAQVKSARLYALMSGGDCFLARMSEYSTQTSAPKDVAQRIIIILLSLFLYTVTYYTMTILYWLLLLIVHSYSCIIGLMDVISQSP